MARLGGRTHRELVHVQLAEHDRARIPKVLRHGQFIGRLEAVEDVRARRGADALRAVEILDAERDAFERADILARRKPLVQLLGGVHRLVRRNEHERVQRFVPRLDGGKASLGEFGGFDLLRAQLVARFRDRQTVQCHGIIR